MGGLKQQQCILSWFWKPRVQNAGVGVVRALFLQTIREDLPLPCSAGGGWLQEVLGLWPHDSLTSSSSSSLKSPPTFFLTRTLVLALTAHLDNPGIAPRFKIIHLITSAKSFVFQIKPHSQVLGTKDMHVSFWGTTMKPTTFFLSQISLIYEIETIRVAPALGED